MAAEARDQGKSLSETKAMIEDILPRLRTYFLVDDLYHLMRGGRLSKSSAIIGSLINIKPLLWLDASGKLVPLAKIRGCKKAIKEMVLQATQDIGHSTAIVAYANDIEARSSIVLATFFCDFFILFPPFSRLIIALFYTMSNISFILYRLSFYILLIYHFRKQKNQIGKPI